MKIFPVLLFVLVAVSTATAADGPCIAPGQGHFYIHTDTGGLFGAFAHEHLIEAKKIEGCATIDPGELAKSSVKLTFAAAEVRVLDPKEPKDRSKVQATMESEVLRVSEYPQIVFESTAIERAAGTGTFRVNGNLTIRGKTLPIVVPLTLTPLDGGGYRVQGQYRFKQTSFGIKPVSLAGGAVKVKDEVRTDFDLVLK